MQKILVLGAGRSASSLISYLLSHSFKNDWFITVADISLELAQEKINNHSKAKAVSFNVSDAQACSELVRETNIVISMLPATMHFPIAVECVKQKKHLVTASYVSKEMASLNDDAQKNRVLLLNEIGLDPGIDHMSAMEIIDKCKEAGEEIVSFKSYCGGLIAPESNDNPWGYKFTWNPRNVVLAGQGTAKYIENGNYRYKPYNRLFTDIETIEVDGYGKYDGYANRDSLSYRKIYGLENIPTMLRGTLRMQGFCEAWNAFVQLGLTDDTYIIENANNLTYTQLIESFLPNNCKGSNTKSRLATFLCTPENSEIIKKLDYLEVFSDKKITTSGTPAQILQYLLEEKWKLKPHDKDLVVLQHLFIVRNKAEKTKNIISSLVVKGEDQTHTAMAKTVGLPAAIATKLILQNKINAVGVQVPVSKDIYIPVLAELKSLGIIFSEKIS